MEKYSKGVSLYQGYHSPGKPGIWSNKLYAWKNHGILKKDIFMEKSWDFVSVILCHCLVFHS